MLLNAADALPVPPRRAPQATHIFDGLEAWPTHLAFFADGEMKINEPSSSFPELAEGRLVNLVAA